MRIFCNNRNKIEERFPNLRIKEDRVVVKQYGDGGKFTGSIVMPTIKYPVATGGDIHILGLNNLEIIEDRKIIDAIDTVPYVMGHCYTNSGNVAKALRDIGENPRIFCGWAFQDLNMLPTHHCWVMLGDTHLIDLSAMMTYMMKEAVESYSDEVLKGWNKKEWQDFLIGYMKRTENYKNSERVILGLGDDMVYIGGEVKDVKEARDVWKRLKKEFPDHETDRGNISGIGNLAASPTQIRYLME